MDTKHRLRIKSCAAKALLSNKQEEFNVRLIEQYAQHECLWNMSHPTCRNVALKQAAWEKVTKAMGAHLTVAFVRNCINELRFRYNVSKLAQTEYEMGGCKGKPPEKYCYADKFAFLDDANSSANSKEHRDKQASTSKEMPLVRDAPSISSIVKNCLHHDEQEKQQLLVYQRSMGIPPRIISSMNSMPLPHLLMRGQSISRTMLQSSRQKQPQKQMPTQNPTPQLNSEDEEIYRIHWRVRKQLCGSQGTGHHTDFYSFARAQQSTRGPALYALDDDN